VLLLSRCEKKKTFKTIRYDKIGKGREGKGILRSFSMNRSGVISASFHDGRSRSCVTCAHRICQLRRVLMSEWRPEY
jgi:hypothetical protein